MAETNKNATAANKAKTVAKEPAKQAEEKKTAKAEKEETFTRADVERLVAEAVAKAVASVQQTPQVVSVAQEAPQVTLRFQCDCSPEHQLMLGVNGKFGIITGKSGTFKVPRDAFFGEFRDSVVQALLASRDLVVLDGLTDEERELYGVKYTDGEVLEPQAFHKLLDMGDELCDVFPKLCMNYKEMVARRFADAFERGDRRVTRDLVLKLNALSKQDYVGLPPEDIRRKGLFHRIITQMNIKDGE